MASWLALGCAPSYHRIFAFKAYRDKEISSSELVMILALTLVAMLW